MRAGGRAIAIAAALLVALAACNQERGADEVDDAALDQIALAIEDELNQPPLAIQKLLKQASEETQVGWDSLTIAFNDRGYPVDWWLYRRGYLTLAGRQYVGRPVFALSPKARELITADPAWFEAAAGQPTEVDCNSPAAMAALGCEVNVIVTPSLTEAGRAVLGAAAPLAPISVRALVAPTGEEGWVVQEFTASGGGPVDAAINAILGPPEAQAAARDAVLSELKLTLDSVPDIGRELPPPPVLDDIAPLAPIY